MSCSYIFTSEHDFEFLFYLSLLRYEPDSLLIHFKLVWRFKISYSAELTHRIQINLMCTWWCNSEVKTFWENTALICQKNHLQDFCFKNFSGNMRQTLVLTLILFNCACSLPWNSLSKERQTSKSLATCSRFISAQQSLLAQRGRPSISTKNKLGKSPLVQVPLRRVFKQVLSTRPFASFRNSWEKATA